MSALDKTMQMMRDEIAALRQQLAEAQQKTDVAEGRLEISLNANNRLKQRLADAEGQEAVIERCAKVCESQRHMTLDPLRTYNAEEIMRAGRSMAKSLARQIRMLKTKPIPPDADERVKELVVQTCRDAGNYLSRVMIEHPFCDPVQVIKSYADVALAASKGEKG